MPPRTFHLSPAGLAVVAAVLPLIATVGVTARIVERRCKRYQLRSEEWAVAVALFLLWGLAIICFVGVGIDALGLHSHLPSAGELRAKPYLTIHLGPEDKRAEEIVRAYSIVEKITFAVIKSSVILSYKRIFFAQPHMSKICIAILIFLACQAVAFIIAAALQCTIRNWGRWWQPWALQNHCGQAQMVWIGFSVTDVFTDLVVLCLPIPLIWSLNLKRSKKVVTIIIFSLGCLSTAVGIARMVYLITYAYSGGMGFRDLLGLMTDVLLLSLVEASVAVFAAGLPAVRSLISMYRHKKTHSTRDEDTVTTGLDTTLMTLSKTHTRGKSLEIDEYVFRESKGSDQLC